LYRIRQRVDNPQAITWLLTEPFAKSGARKIGSCVSANDQFMADQLIPIPDRFRSALVALLHAFDYASDGTVDRWQLAIELTELLSTGATLSDIRWLILRGFAEHAKEITIPGDAERSFRPLTPTCIPTDACLMLSVIGAATLRCALGFGSTDTVLQAIEVPVDRLIHPLGTCVARINPEWDSAKRELRYKEQVIKRYRVPARNQILILSAFQELAWPDFIDDPLPPEDEQDSKQRLQGTIKSLNRNQITPLLRFHGNGNGLQVFWEPVHFS
jgi:hypothetical protein